MSIFSDYECGALSDDDFRAECIRMNHKDRYEMEHQFDEEDDEDERQSTDQ